MKIAIVALAVCLSATMAGAWFAALRTDRSGWIDAIWSFATGLFGAAAGAAAVVPLLTGRRALSPDATVVPIICGGNVDLARLKELL